jgi:hypothetical protein
VSHYSRPSRQAGLAFGLGLAWENLVLISDTCVAFFVRGMLYIRLTALPQRPPTPSVSGPLREGDSRLGLASASVLQGERILDIRPTTAGTGASST